MGNYIVRRFMYAVVTLMGVSFISFLIVYAVPADPAAVIAGPNADASAIANIRHQWGLDRPFIAQYGTYFLNLLRGDWGTSFFNQLPVLRQLLGRFPATAQLGLIAFLLQLLIGIPLGAVAAIRQNTRTDNVIMAGVLIGLSIPRFWLGVILLFVFALKLPWFPLGGYGGLDHVVLPAITVGVTGAAYYTRLLRSSMIEVKRQDYVLAATAKGISRARVQVRHVMRNSLIPCCHLGGHGPCCLSGRFNYRGNGFWMARHRTTHVSSHQEYGHTADLRDGPVFGDLRGHRQPCRRHHIRFPGSTHQLRMTRAHCGFQLFRESFLGR